MKLVDRIRAAWRRSNEQRDQEYAEDVLARREAELQAADDPLPASRTNSDWSYIPPP